MCGGVDVGCDVNELYIIPNRQESTYNITEKTVSHRKYPTDVKVTQEIDLSQVED